MECIDAWGIVGGSGLGDILNAVRNRVLDLSLELWKTNPELGEIGIPISRAVEQHATQVVTNIIYGPASIIGTAHNASVALIVNQGDFASLMRALEGSGVQPADIAELKSALEQDGPPKAENGGFGAKVCGWRDKMIAKAREGSWQVGVGVAADLITRALSSYYGLSG